MKHSPLKKQIKNLQSTKQYAFIKQHFVSGTKGCYTADNVIFSTVGHNGNN